MNKDQLYIIKNDFQQEGTTYYCPGCIETLGLIEAFPQLKDHVEIHYVDFDRPRPALVELLGEENQGAPVLILAKDPENLPAELGIEQTNGRSFIPDVRNIGRYFAHVYGTSVPFY